MTEQRKQDPAAAVGVRPSSPESFQVETRELQLKIHCRGKTAALALEEVRLGLDEAKAQGRDPLIILEDLGFLQDSVATLIKGLCRGLVGYPGTVTFWESSGYTEAFLSVMEAAPES
ncbi:MAG TPA: hypothetical protein VKU80_08640 [Planctomycetota bacterium]|nr:hypothetical protein [Planctomycetota bacterium]